MTVRYSRQGRRNGDRGHGSTELPVLPGALRVRTRQELPLMIVVPEGTLTPETAARLRRSLLKCLSECPDAIIVDLSRLSADSDQSLALFRTIHHHASIWPAVPLLLCGPSPSMAARLNRTGLHRIIPVHATVAEASAAAAGPPTIARAEHDLLPTVTAPAQARAIVAEVCRAWNLADLTGPASLIISELVTNAVTHATGPIRLTLVLRHPDLHLVVRDSSLEPPRRRELPPPLVEGMPAATSGRGLHLLEETAHSWGYLNIGTGKVVWARLRRPPAQPIVRW